MTKKTILTSLIILLGVATACVEKENLIDVNNYEGEYTVSLPEGMVNGKTVWVAGDQILVHGEYSSDQQIYTLTPADIAEDGKTCTISVRGIAPYEQKNLKSVYYAAYPAEMVVNDKHCKDVSKFNGTNAVLLAGYNKGRTFIMETLTGGITFTINGEFDSYSMTGNNDENIYYSSLSARINEKSKIYANSKGDEHKSLNGNLIADGKTSNYICFSGDINLLDGLYLTVYNNGKPVKTFYTEDVYSIKRNAFIQLGDITNKLADYKAPAGESHTSSIPTAGANDLSETETANCYIVSSPGTYCFKATKGNTSETLNTIDSVELLWESWNTTEIVEANSVISGVDFEKGKIYFSVSEGYHPGNAVIAAKNDMGAIIWSWHIWVPETSIETDLYGLSRRMTMDRNLGALVAASPDGTSAKSVGLVYQWGRKDPFVGIGDFSTEEAAYVSGEARSLYGGAMTTSKTVKNPTAFADFEGNWNAVSSSEEYWSTSKTMYDPCPPGYRVPYRTEFLLFNESPAEAPGWEYDSENNFFASGNPQTYFPLGGYLSWNGNYKHVGTGARVWSAKPHSSAANAYNFRISPDGDDVDYGYSGKEKANGYAVRCVVYDATPFENDPSAPVMGKYKKFTVNMQELSGLCLHNDKSFLWGVGDQGVLAKISFDGKMEKVMAQGLDMEAITIDPETGDLYLGLEANHVYKVAAPDYKKAVKVFDVLEASDYGNSGVEGISWYKDGMILVGTQTGAYMWAYTLDGTVVWKKSMRSVAIGMQEIADIHYDPVRDQIWIIDSETQSIYLFNGDADKHLATYRVTYGGNCESVHIDYNNSCVWIADDSEPSELFKIDFTF